MNGMGNTPHGALECYPSRLKLLGLLGLTCVMVAACWFCTTLKDPFANLVGWIGVGFFGLGFIAIPVMFFRTGAQVIISHEGIEDRRNKMGVIPWVDVRSVSIRSIQSTKFLCVEVVDPEKYLSRAPRWVSSIAKVNAAMGFPAMSISFGGLSPGLKEAWAYLQIWWPKMR